MFIEIIFLSGFAYKYKTPTGIIPRWDKLLTGKSARLIVTMDSPPLYYKFISKDPGFKMMKDILNFCGIKPVYRNYFGSVKMSSKNKRKTWLNKSYKVGLHE